MSPRRASLVVILLALAGSGSVRAQEKRKTERIVAVVHASSALGELGATDLKNIYLGRKKTWTDGTPIRPFMRPHQHPAGFELLRTILKMTPARFRQHWLALELSGQGTMPKILGTPSEVVEKVSSLKGGIGYLTESEAKGLAPSVKVVRIRY